MLTSFYSLNITKSLNYNISYQNFSVLILFSSLVSVVVLGQSKSGIVSGPWAGNVELRNATIWIEVGAQVKSVSIKFYAADKIAQTKKIAYKGELGKDFNPVKIELNGLQMNTTYNYSVVVDGKLIQSSLPLKFTTKDFDYASQENKKHAFTITIKPHGIESAQRIIMSISSAGYTTVQVSSNSREMISFYGTIVQ